MTLFLRSILLIFTLNCSFLPGTSKDENKNFDLLLLLGLVQSVEDSYARLFYMSPLFLSNSDNLIYLQAPSEQISSKKKLVIIHGWNTQDPENPGTPSDDDLKRRIRTTYSHLFSGSTLLESINLKNYDVYFFTYLTSKSIESNGIRLRSQLDSAFAGQNNNVYIFAHSMGGLITRIALYQGSVPSYLSKIITSGTPYHGSPWASSAFLENKSILGDLAAYLSNTTGGQNLSWDNYDFSLSGSSNEVLTRYNSNTSRDGIITAYYNSLESNGAGYEGSDTSLLPVCLLITSKFSPSDCIVPSRSAAFFGGSLSLTRDLGKLHHVDMNLRHSTVNNTLLIDLP
ncbi:MAG: hypothetical protein H7A24_13925 [Leptospiraceae bacterium]|nr:hypothetical protein [Leptospiraceae bacterium]MCP5512978.1 hypothetical protein [Leptospiraceae bacterium]